MEIDSNYLQKYNNLIKFAQSQNRKKLKVSDPNYICYHEHHIKPKSIYPELVYDKTNIVLLTPSEHWDAHYFLWKAYPDILEYAAAFYYMSHLGNKTLSKTDYQKLKEQEALFLSEKRKGSNNPMYGKNAYENKSNEEKQKIGKKISDKLKGQKRGIMIYNKNTLKIQYVKNESEIPIGYEKGHPTPSQETREKMSQSAKKRGAPVAAYRDKRGKNNPMYGKSQTVLSRQKSSETRKRKLLENHNYGVSGKKAYYHKDTLIIKYFLEIDTIPKEYIKGRPPKQFREIATN